MPSFQEEFLQSRGKPIYYNGRKLYLADKIELAQAKELLLQVLSTNAEQEQGVAISSDCLLKVGDSVGRKFAFWEEYARAGIPIYKQSERPVYLWIWNIWKDSRGIMDAWHHGAAMYIEDLGAERIYHCNDGHPDDDFDDIVFKISGIY